MSVLYISILGTGKTLVAAALATEINREGIGKVAFFPRKGADVLDKWVGGSEKNLRDLFEKVFFLHLWYLQFKKWCKIPLPHI